MSSNKRKKGENNAPPPRKDEENEQGEQEEEELSTIEALDAIAKIIEKMKTEDLIEVTTLVERVQLDRVSKEDGEGNGGNTEEMMQLEAIRTWMREQVEHLNKKKGTDLSGVIPSEKILDEPVVTADAFLYGDEEVEAMRQEGRIPLGRCKKCGSTDVEEISVMTHSLSVDEAKEIFLNIVPDLEGRVVVDVGSRLGVVLFAGAVFSNAKKLIGIEMNKDFAGLQKKAVELFNVKKVEVICSDVRDQGKVLGTANVVILHNAFEHFFDAEKAFELWEFIRDSLKKDTLIVASPPLSKQLEKITHVDVPKFLQEWVEEIETNLEADDGEEDYDMFLYKVL